MKDLALDRTPLQHGALGALELVEPSGQEGSERGRDDDLASALRCHRHYLGHEQRGAAATVERLLHHAHVLVTDGVESYRLAEATAGKGVMPLP